MMGSCYHYIIPVIAGDKFGQHLGINESLCIYPYLICHMFLSNYINIWYMNHTIYLCRDSGHTTVFVASLCLTKLTT